MDPVSHEREQARQIALEIGGAINVQDALAIGFGGLSNLLLNILAELRALNEH